ncbi:MAG: hypothetical protein RBU25_19610, partial [Lentisphaeria bacterium]|nr:hypothetical protein [Lentisphaeria bacterium]
MRHHSHHSATCPLARWVGVRLACVLALVVLIGHSRGAVSVPRFSGTDSYINLGTPEVMQISANHPFTIEGWVWFESVGSSTMLYSKNSFRGGEPYSYMFGFRDTGNCMTAYTGNYGSPSKTWVDIPLPAPIEAG